MRHRGQNEAGETGGSTSNGTVVTLADLQAAAPSAPGKHRAPVAPLIPEQKLRTHDNAVQAPVVPRQATASEGPENVTEPAPEATATATVTPISRASQAATALEIPHTAQWRASHLPRTLAATLLVLAAAGTTALGVRYAQTRTTDDFITLSIGLGIVVVLWAVMIASTPQVVSLNGSKLTVRNTSSSETFELTDGLQAVDVVGDPRTSYWAVLLHRPNNTTVVLRGHDVNAMEVDPIVRHYRTVATRRFTDREARFSS